MEMDSKLTGNWYLQMDAVQRNPNAVYTFRLLAFAATLRELDYFSPKKADMRNGAAHIYTTLYIIKNHGAMAFETSLGLSFSKLVQARQEKKSFDYFNLTLKKFSPNGGVRYTFGLAMQSVLIGDVQKNWASDNVLITFGKANMNFDYDSNDETVQLDRAVRGG